MRCLIDFHLDSCQFFNEIFAGVLMGIEVTFSSKDTWTGYKKIANKVSVWKFLVLQKIPFSWATYERCVSLNLKLHRSVESLSTSTGTSSYIDANPRMIIGIEHVHLITNLKIREGGRSDSVATKTRLGWFIYGRNSESEASVDQLAYTSDKKWATVTCTIPWKTLYLLIPP